MKNISKVFLFVLCCGAALLAESTTYNYDRSANFAQFTTYKWVTIPGGIHPNQLIDQQIRQAIDAQLSTRGLTQTNNDSPTTMLVGYQIGLDREKQLNMFGGFRGWGGMGQATTSTINNGILVIDFYNPAAQQLLWRGQGEEQINPSGNPDKNQNNLNKAVAKILQHFPPNWKK